MRGTWTSQLVAALVIGSGRGWGQSVTLQIRPHVNDTLRMQLDQQSEVTSVRRTNLGQASAIVFTTMQMFSRAIVESANGRESTVLAVTDSVHLSTSDDRSRGSVARAEEEMRGQRVRFRVAPDGTVSMNAAGDGVSREVAQVVSVMPAAFPKAPINVGESWIREMALPAGTQVGAQVSGKLYVTFRLDSVTHAGDWAFVSMRGEMHPVPGASPGAGGTVEKCLVNGTMLVDHKRGWLTESWFSILMSSVVTPPLTSGVVSMHMQTRITQHMHTVRR